MYISWQLFLSKTELIISVLEKLFLHYGYQSFILARVQVFFVDQLNISEVLIRSLIRYMYVAKVSCDAEKFCAFPGLILEVCLV